MRKLALAISTLLVLMAASFVSPVGALAASAPHVVARVVGPDSGARPPRSPVHMASSRVPSTSTFTSPVNCDDAYHFVGSPNGPVAGPNFLVSTASLNAGDIWAVGNSTNASGYDQLLAEHWNGTSWSIASTPSSNNGFLNDFNAVAAVSTNDVWAVGDYWSNVDGATPPNPVNITIIAQHWDGATWTNVPMAQPTGNFSYLFGVTAIASNNVWAVGTWFNFGVGGYQTLVEHWDGVSWAQMPSVNTNTTDNELLDVSALNSTDVWVVGVQSVVLGSLPFLSLAQHWDGVAWTTLTTPNLGPAGSSNDIVGVNALEAGHAVGVGVGNFSASTPRVAVAWDLTTSGPSSASFETGPGTGDNALLGVARAGAGVWAVGYSRPTMAIDSPRQTMVFPATWNSTTHTLTWGPMGSSDSPSAINNALIGVTAVSPYTFWAVGYDTNSSSVEQTLTEAYCARNFTMTGPSTAHANFAFSVTVSVKNGNGTTATGYGGTVHFTSSDGTATLPPNYAFLAGDNGAHTFSGVVLRTAGSQTITVADIAMPLTVPASITVTVCIGLCQSSPGTPGSRGNTNQGATGTKGGRTGANPSGAGTPGTRVPRLGLSSQSSENAPSTAPATNTDQATNVVAAAPAAASTSAQSAAPAGGAVGTGPGTTSVQAPAQDVVSLVVRKAAVRPPDQAPWNVLLLIPLLACALALIVVRRRTLKEKSNARI